MQVTNYIFAFFFLFKGNDRYILCNDTRSQLQFLEQLDQVEKRRKDEEEKEELLRAAKVRKFRRQGTAAKIFFLFIFIVGTILPLYLSILKEIIFKTCCRKNDILSLFYVVNANNYAGGKIASPVLSRSKGNFWSSPWKKVKSP